MKNLGIKKIHSVHFAVKDLATVRAFYEHQFGFTPLWKASQQLIDKTGQDSIVYGGGSARVVLSAPKTDTCKAARYLKLHPEGVMSVAFSVQDIGAAFKTLDSRGATLMTEINAHGDYKDFEITTPLGDVQFRFIESPDDPDADGMQKAFAPGFEPVTAQAKKSPIHWIGIDHLTCNARTLKPIVDWFASVMGFTQFWEIQFHTTQLAAGKSKETGSGLKSIVMWDESSEVKLALNEPLRPFFRASQIERFVEDNRGPGVQHIALAVPSAIDTLDQLSKAGLRFLAPPPSYYEKLPGRFAEVGFDMSRIKESMDEIKRTGLLVDGSKEGYLLQIFTDELREIDVHENAGPAFYEVIQREGDRGFGYGNFRALFEAIESLQAQR